MLSVRDRAYFTLVDQDEQDNLHVSELTAQQAALARLAALVALDGAQVSFMHVVEEALSAGASVDDLVGTLIAVMPSTGADRVVSAAPKLALALGPEAACVAIPGCVPFNIFGGQGANGEGSITREMLDWATFTQSDQSDQEDQWAL